ncbi:imidazole glycerol phosphate synthase subunit HisH [Companilactobacillus pabuli]|jgi:glutamine amidotransferase|uniref:Imidazole glycerol phosphate synthase subunit HisH n=1 Tax=Companilactobacillus pabuli TaxID=2714036 RepID=A0A7L7KVZ3_9LACO|nr:imidazole glycerol phosphate synthase subunit HisH [Companilactobacillus pabuli]MDG5112520.1 imidazole glycerol phosphate synthase subunit HisH [Companilactobacillus pabuli]QMT83492.1 imidazole glycerol phosphate synthase subunit HisH [Companilactobacillus pabuli]
MFAIVDYDTGNTRNLKKALDYLNIENQLTADEQTILDAQAVILPGVGAFKPAMQALENRNLVAVLQQVKKNKIPILGICLGMQLLFESSEEYGYTKGLGLIKGNVKAIPKRQLKIPQMGWNQNQTFIKTSFPIDQQYTYFVHSYYADCPLENIVAGVDYGQLIPSLVQNNRVIGMQFHPEKSGRVGLNLLKNFQRMVIEDDFSSN